MEFIVYEQKGAYGIITINREKALNAFQNAINLGNWGSYAEIAKIYGNKKNRCYNPLNEDLAWKKDFENLQAHNNDLSLDDWDDKSIGENFFTRLFQLLIENKEIPKLMDDLAYAHMEYLQDALETQISSMEKDSNTFMLAEQYKLHIGKYSFILLFRHPDNRKSEVLGNFVSIYCGWLKLRST